jgi:cytosine/adenosine deaminase-related metal-dependent hydrolase
VRFALETERGQELWIENGRIAESGGKPGPRFRISAEHVRPGLINAHDHLGMNHFPRLGRPPYANLYEWADDVQRNFASEVGRCRTFPERDALLFGALKNLISGVTRAVHHDRWSAHFETDFPIKVESVRVAHSLRFEEDPLAALQPASPTDRRPACIHLAEGVDEVARGEVGEAEARGVLLPNLWAVHLLGAGKEDVCRLRAAAAAFVWCPSSALHLYGSVALDELFSAGLDVLLGSDSLLSADGTLLDEIRLAASLARMEPSRLEDAVGAIPARRLGLAAPSVTAGAPADVIALRRALLDARSADVALVLVDGVPRYGDVALAPLFDAAGVATEPLTVGGEAKLVAAPLGRVARDVLDLSPECARIFL